MPMIHWCRWTTWCTPHLGYVTRDEWEIAFRSVFRQINAFVDGHPIKVVNPEALGG